MTSIQGRRGLYRERLSLAFFDSFPLPELDNNLYDQFVRSLKVKFLIAVIPATTPSVPKYTEEDLQRILKTILEVWAQIISKKFLNKSLEACVPDMYCDKFYIECYNFCRQYEDYFAINRAKRFNQNFFAVFFL